MRIGRSNRLLVREYERGLVVRLSLLACRVFVVVVGGGGGGGWWYSYYCSALFCSSEDLDD